MSIAVLIGVHDGLVLAADSASTLVVNIAPQGGPMAANVYDNANKIRPDQRQTAGLCNIWDR